MIMYTGTYMIADHCFRFDTYHSEIHRLAEAFKTTLPFEVRIESPEWMPLWLQKQYYPDADHLKIGPNTEVLSLLTSVMLALEPSGYLAIHGCAFALDDSGILLTGASGSGKTTHALHWQNTFGKRFRFINGDIPFVKKERSGVFAYGTPWNGKERLGGVDRVCLKAIIHLNRAEENHLKPTTFLEARPWLEEAALVTGHLDGYSGRDLDRMQRNLEQIASALPLFELYCTPDPISAQVAHNELARYVML